ncbi:MAG: hypothetical protein KME47_09815 [Nodosilinea sp. WJT8-NPBG4]|jgi:hypothetical protein|nr:hypothetical protein [Nodosilinea sp. WJT8-NPBG4]
MLEDAIQPFLEAGFKKFPTNGVSSKHAAFGLQKIIRDSQGTKYFVTVYVYDFSSISDYPNPNKASFSLSSHFDSELLGSDQVEINTTVDSPKHAIETQEKLWVALQGKYYERN